MTKTAGQRIILFFACFVFLAGPLLATEVSNPIYTYATVVAPTQVSLEIYWWSGRTLPSPAVKLVGSQSANVPEIDFNAAAQGQCLPGRTSWDDSPDDGFVSRSGNIGFTAHCIGPIGSTFKVSSGKLKKSDGPGEIPYFEINPANGSRIKYFGFSCRLDDEGGRYVAGSGSDMQTHSSGGWTYTLSASDGYGHDFAVYNCLKIPVTVVPGPYATTGTAGYEHLRIEFY